MLDTILLEIVKFLGFMCIAGALAILAFSLWWRTFFISKRGKLLIRFFLAYKEEYLHWLKDNQEWREIERIKNISVREKQK